MTWPTGAPYSQSGRLDPNPSRPISKKHRCLLHFAGLSGTRKNRNSRNVPALLAAQKSAQAVYVISDGQILTKIGRSATPSRRLANLQTAHGTSLFLEYVCWIENAREIEKAAHRAMRALRRKGEWFACKPNFAIETVKSIIDQFGYPYEVTVNSLHLCESIREATWRAARAMEAGND